MSLERTLTGYRLVETQYGDTLQAISLREMGDASRWPELIAINGLKPPYLSALPGVDGVLQYGQMLRVPAAQVTVTAAASPEEVFGVDVALDASGALVAEGGDFSLVSGVDNLASALSHRLDTDAGELIFHPEYGSRVRRLVGKVNGPTTAILAASYAKDAVAADPRIDRIVAAQASVSGDAVSVSIAAEPVSGRVVTINQEL